MANKPHPNYKPGDVKTVFDPNKGISSTFFEGEKRADGDYHGHIDVNEKGDVTYARDSGEKK